MGRKEAEDSRVGREAAGALVLIKYYHSASFHAGSVMKYSALRNPHSTSCYGILSDLFWGGYTLAVSSRTESAAKQLGSARLVLPARPLGGAALEIINISR